MPPTAAAPAPDNHLGIIGIKGRNGFDPPLTLLEGQCREALNVDWYRSSLGRKRMGADAIGITGGAIFTSGIRALGRFVPGSDEGLAEMWAVDGTFQVKRLASGTAWANVALDDAITSLTDINFATLNGKYFFAYKSGLNRLHVYDPVDAKVRRCGLAVSAAPTVADTGSGGYTATLRYYKQRWARYIAGVKVLQGELSTAVSFTPSGSGTAARITQSAPIGEGETHWQIFGSPDDSTYFQVASVAIATTTYDDSAVPTLYTGEADTDVGAYLPPPAARYLVADDSRIVMAGAFETSTGVSVAPTSRRIWWTSVLGASNIGDDERVSVTTDIKSYSDLEESITGLSQPVNGSFLAFSYRSQWKFIGTGDVSSPYNKFRVSGGAGCVSHRSIVVASDATGSPSTYWWSERGPMRAGAAGQQFIGQDVLDYVNRVNLSSTTPIHAVSYPLLHQVWFYVPLDSANVPNLKVVFDTFLGKVVEISVTGSSAVRFGWSIHDGQSALAYCSVMFAGTLGASMSHDLKPYIGYGGGTAIWACESATTTNDAGTNFRAYVESKTTAPWGLGRQGGLKEEACLVAKAAPRTSVSLMVIRDDGAETTTSTLDLSPVTSAQETVFPQFDGSQLAGANVMKFRIGDVEAISNAWNLYALTAPYNSDGDR